MFGSRRHVTARWINDSHAVFDRHKLFTARLAVPFRTTKTGQNQSLPPSHKMGPIKLRGNMNCEAASLQSFSRELRVRACGQKISSQSKEHLNLTAVHRLDGIHSVLSGIPWRFELIALSE